MNRVSTSLLFDRGISSMLEQQAKLSRTQIQVASGKRILSPKDDPAGAAYALDLRTAISQTEQYQANADRASSRLELQESTLQSVDNLIPRIKELTVQGLNDTNTPGDRRAISQELRHINDQLMALANTKDSNGEYIFAGFDANTIPFDNPAEGTFTYAGDTGSRSLQISATRQIQDRENGFDVFMDVESIGPGEFGKIIFGQIMARDHFIVILAPGSTSMGPADPRGSNIQLGAKTS